MSSIFITELDEFYHNNIEKVNMIEDSTVSSILSSKHSNKSLMIGRSLKQICDANGIRFSLIVPGSTRRKGLRINIDKLKKYPSLWTNVRTLACFLLIEDSKDLRK